MKGYARLCVFVCVFTSLPTHLLAQVLVHRKTCWQTSLHVCFVNTVCSGVKCCVYMCVCVCRGAWESEHVCTCCELLGPWLSCSPLLEGVGCRQWPCRRAYGPSLGCSARWKGLWFLWPPWREQPVRQKACQLQFSFTNHLVDTHTYTHTHATNCTHIHVQSCPCSLETFNSHNVKIVFDWHYYKASMFPCSQTHLIHFTFQNISNKYHS